MNTNEPQDLIITATQVEMEKMGALTYRAYLILKKFRKQIGQ